MDSVAASIRRVNIARGHRMIMHAGLCSIQLQYLECENTCLYSLLEYYIKHCLIRVEI